MTSFAIPEEVMKAAEAGKWVFRERVPEGPLKRLPKYWIGDDPDEAPRDYVEWIRPEDNDDTEPAAP